MRKIKFRAWNKTVKKFTYFGNGEPVITTADVSNWGLAGMFLAAEKRIYLTPYEDFQQFTGIRDKNGKEIYEGDIVTKEFLFAKGDSFTGMVKYDEGAYWIDNGKNAIPLFSEVDILEVIETIYENADLMEG